MSRRPIKLLFDCSEDWESFEGDAQTRLCQTCVKNVHNLTEMTRPEVNALLDGPREDGLCVRYQQDSRGRVLMRSERRPGRLVWKRLRPFDQGKTTGASTAEPTSPRPGSVDSLKGDPTMT